MTRTIAAGGKPGPKKWMSGVVKHPGGLHKALHVPAGDSIPAGKVEAATRSDNPRVRRMATLAQTFAKTRP